MTDNSEAYRKEKVLKELAEKNYPIKDSVNMEGYEERLKNTPNKPVNQFGLNSVDSEQVINLLKHDILLTMYKKNPNTDTEKELNKNIQKLYYDWYNVELKETNHRVLSTTLLSLPHEGKTTAFKVAAKEVAQALNCNFVINPSDDQILNKNDFVYYSVELNKESSPNITNFFKERLSKLIEASAGILLLEDIAIAPPPVQNIIISIVDEKCFHGLELDNCYIGLTSNINKNDNMNIQIPVAICAHTHVLMLDNQFSLIDKQFEKLSFSEKRKLVLENDDTTKNTPKPSLK